MNAFAHISHTFTHEDQDNSWCSTYFDAYREIAWNQAWLKNVGIMGTTKWSGTGTIPPAAELASALTAVCGFSVYLFYLRPRAFGFLNSQNLQNEQCR
jgi:hypothetical protein